MSKHMTNSCSCPRCGYDQRGVIAAWRDLCPLQGTCSECGLQFIWAEALVPEKFEPQWCVEFAHNARQVPWRSFRTALKAFWPWSFWTSLKMVDQPRWKMIAAHLLMWCVICYLLFLIAHAAAAWRMWQSEAGPTGWGATSTTTPWDCAIRAAILPFSDKIPGTYTGFGVRPGAAVPHNSPRQLFVQYWLVWLPTTSVMLAILVLSGAAFAVLPQSRRQAKVRWAHIIRIVLHGSIMIVPPTILYTFAVGVGHRQAFMVMANLAGVLVVLFIPMQLVWWSTATGRYLKMRHAWGVGAAVVIMSFLSTFVILLYWQWLSNLW